MQINNLPSKAALFELSLIATEQSMTSSTPEINVVQPPDEVVVKADDFVADQIPEQLKDECLVKYFRCRYKDREALKATYDNDQQRRIEREISRIERLRKAFEEEGRNQEAIESFKYRRSLWRRHAIENCEENLNHLPERVKEMVTLEAPKKSKLKQGDATRRTLFETRILTAVKSWEEAPKPPLPKKLREEATAKEKAEAEAAAEKTAKTEHPLKYLCEKVKGWRKAEEKRQPPVLKSEESVDTSRLFVHPEDSYGISVHRMTLRQSDPSCPSSYMSYDTKRYPLSEILVGSDTNPLTAKCEKKTIRYFHFPANNMHWIEEAIARYYGEKTPGEFNWRKHGDYCAKSSNLLCRKFWTSLQHGGVYDPVHARHMRSHCSLITPDAPCNTEPVTGSKNFVIFMPYLHWETHKRRKKMTDIMKEVTSEYHRDRPHVTENMREELAKSAEELWLKHARQLTDFLSSEELEKEKAKKAKPKKLKKNEKAQERGPLGEYLLQIARVYDALDIEPDVRILRDHLHKDPPLHARRTLDQSYYWKLQNTDGRDEDQVVYRETKRGKNVLRTSRVIMVDQLWLYILDDNTIISSFPRRWGRNKPDWSGVHKGIRARLDHLREGEIQSVYDMALLIINQCSTVFFDRSKPVDERPEVLDIFSNALSHVSGMKCISFETFWRQLNKLSSGDYLQADFEATARKYLNINPEGELLRETHDIIEELRMMAHIFTDQHHVVEQFTTHLQNLHEKESARETTDKKMLDVMVEVKKLLEERFSSQGTSSMNGASGSNGTSASKKFFPHTETKIENEVSATNHPASQDTAVQHEETSSQNGMVAIPTQIEAATQNRSTENGLPSPTGIAAPPGAADAGSQTTISVAKISVPESTVQFAKDVGREILNRRSELQKLEESTSYVSQQLKDLLDLKQQQASIIEAKYALKRADESVTQGRSIMLFTIVTIIFLPLSFMSSVFGMNASDFTDAQGNNSMSLRQMFKLLFPISVGVIIISLALAFSTFIRSLLYFLGSITWAFLFEYSYLRRLWQFSVKTANRLGKRKERPRGRDAQKNDGFYGLKNEAVRWIYGRKERDMLRKEWEKAKVLEGAGARAEGGSSDGNGGGSAGVGGRRPASRTRVNGGMTKGGGVIEGRGLSTGGSSSGLPSESVGEGSASGSADGRKRSRTRLFKRSAGDDSEKSLSDGPEMV